MRYVPCVISTENVTFSVDGQHQVSGILVVPPAPLVCFVLAHGAGAGMRHAFMAGVAGGLADRKVATFRYQFPYMEKGSRRPDRPALAHATVRAAVAEACRLLPGVPLVAGGKSFGGRMTSQAQAAEPLAGVLGLVFLGFPLHPLNQPSSERATHLFDVRIPMLFLQGTRDGLAHLELLELLMKKLGARATLKLLQNADHSFHVPVRSGRTDAETLSEALDNLVGWLNKVIPGAQNHGASRLPRD